MFACLRLIPRLRRRLGGRPTQPTTRASRGPRVAQVLVGGVWAFLALGFMKDFAEIRPAFKRVARAAARRHHTVTHPSRASRARE